MATIRAEHIHATFGIVLRLISCLLLLTSISVAQNISCPDPNAKRQPWSLLTANQGDPVVLSCSVQEFYPFCNLSLAIKIGWRLPKSLLSLNLGANASLDAWSVSSDGQEMRIEKAKLPSSSDYSGIYQCLVLAPLPGSTTEVAWYHLQWAVDVFAAENLLHHGPWIDRYWRNLVIAFAAMLSVILIVVILRLVRYYSYSARTERREKKYRSNSSSHPQIDSVNLPMTERYPEFNNHVEK